MCFLLQMFLFLPALQVNAMRAEANYLDCWCCWKSKFKHEFDKPRGCCGCCRPEWCPPNILSHTMTKVARALTTVAGATLSFLTFAGLLAAGIYGTTQLYECGIVFILIVCVRHICFLRDHQSCRLAIAGTKISRLSGLFRQTRTCAIFTSKTTSISKQELPSLCTRRTPLTTLSRSNRLLTCTIVSRTSTLCSFIGSLRHPEKLAFHVLVLLACDCYVHSQQLLHGLGRWAH